MLVCPMLACSILGMLHAGRMLCAKDASCWEDTLYGILGMPHTWAALYQRCSLTGMLHTRDTPYQSGPYLGCSEPG